MNNGFTTREFDGAAEDGYEGKVHDLGLQRPGAIIILDVERAGRVQTNDLRPRNGGIAYEHDPIDDDTWSLFFDD